jgi:hypothetical protein
LGEEDKSTALGIEQRLQRRKKGKSLPRKVLIGTLAEKVKMDFISGHREATLSTLY